MGTAEPRVGARRDRRPAALVAPRRRGAAAAARAVRQVRRSRPARGGRWAVVGRLRGPRVGSLPTGATDGGAGPSRALPAGGAPGRPERRARRDAAPPPPPRRLARPP